MFDALRRIFFFLFFLLICFTSPPAWATPQTQDRPSPNTIVRSIHERRGNWIALKAGLNLEFITPQGRKIICRGELAYQRLDEKILLRGFNEKNELLFAFKTLDRNFQLYLPLIGEDAHGSIFDLEDSPDIQSQLRALDLYRALKPGAIPVERMNAVWQKNGNILIKIKKGKTGDLLSREILASPKGDVLKEVFYSAAGTPSAEIFRSEFREIKSKIVPKSFFPHRIEITAYPLAPKSGAPKKTVLLFTRLELLSEIPASDFKFSIPENTKRLKLS